MSSVREPGKYSINLSDRDLDELDKLANATKGQDAQTKKWGYTAILNDVLQRTDTAIDIQKESQAYMQTRVKYMSGFVVVMALLLIANFALTLSAVEMSKESHVKKNSLTDKGGNVVQVSSSDFNLGSGGELVQRSSTNTRASVGTAPVLSKYKLSSRIPNKYMEELDSFTVGTSCAKDANAAECNSAASTLKATVLSFKRVPKEGSHCGSIVVFQTDLGEFTLDDDVLFQGSQKMYAEGMFSLGNRRLANMNISAHGRQLMEQGAAPAVNANLHGSFKFLANVKASEFVCKMGGVIGNSFTVLPPDAPKVPYTYIVLKENTCSFGEVKGHACDSELTQGPKPGMVQHSNFTTMRSYEQVLLTQTHRVVVSYFASQPLSRLIQVLHLESQVVTQYLNFRKSKTKLSCLAKPVENAKKTKTGNSNVHLAYLSTAVDESLTSMRWALSPYTAHDTVFPLYTEYWERVGSRMPRRVFLKGDLVIAPKVTVDLFVTPMEFVFFQIDMGDEDVSLWYMHAIFQRSAEDAMHCPAQEPAGMMPPYVGPYGEAGARWIATQLQGGDLEGFGTVIIWPSSYFKYWNAVVASLDTPGLVVETIRKNDGIVPPKNARRLSARRLGGRRRRRRRRIPQRITPPPAPTPKPTPSPTPKEIDPNDYAGGGEGGSNSEAGASIVAGEVSETEVAGATAEADAVPNRRRGWMDPVRSFVSEKCVGCDHEVDSNYAKDEIEAMKETPPPTPSTSRRHRASLKSSADMGEFAGCLKEVKECFSWVSNVKEKSTTTTTTTTTSEEFDNDDDFARQGCQQIIGTVVSNWIDSATRSGLDSLRGEQKKKFVDILKSTQIELSCGPCSIGFSISSLQKKQLPSFACIFSSGTGCYWRPADPGFKMSVLQGGWQKFRNGPTGMINQFWLEIHNGKFVAGCDSSISLVDKRIVGCKEVEKSAEFTRWDFDSVGKRGQNRYWLSVAGVPDSLAGSGRKITNRGGHIVLQGGTSWRSRWRIKVHSSSGKLSFKNTGSSSPWLGSPSGEYGCKICIDLIPSAVSEQAGFAVNICIGIESSCWFFTEVKGERTPPPVFAKTLGVEVSVMGYVRLCVSPFSVAGWVEIKITRGFCKSFPLGLSVTLAIYGGIKFEFEYSRVAGMSFTGSAYVGIAGGVYKSGLGISFAIGGRRRRRRRRRRHKCRCGRVGADGAIASCPRLAAAMGQITFVLKMYPCSKGKDANLEALIGFEMSLNLFGIKINLPKIPDISLFKTKIKKPFGR